MLESQRIMVLRSMCHSLGSINKNVMRVGWLAVWGVTTVSPTHIWSVCCANDNACPWSSTSCITVLVVCLISVAALCHKFYTRPMCSCPHPYWLAWVYVVQEADSKLASQIRTLDESKKEVSRLTDALLQKTWSLVLYQTAIRCNPMQVLHDTACLC